MDSKLRCVFDMPAENEKTVSGWVFMFFLMLALSCWQCVKWQQAWLHSCYPLLKLLSKTDSWLFNGCICLWLCLCEPDFGHSMKWKAIRYPPVSQSRNHPHCLWSPWPPVWMMERSRRSWRNVKAVSWLSFFPLTLPGQKGDQGMFWHIWGVSMISVSAQHLWDY